ncbi:zinc ribbon domain-containing protein YjdM [Asaia sp. As-1742]|uniref:zinc ribbon domain-containing protein YjdM n=1 Tax=Asaia sp. As-1742 TaxID=2608325 RepID=UPI0014239075|nr:zinc ribbon domain-containing protein YjdM [Asaia sp. As-1742]NIE79699.1 alkylphosphonate utilization protein [Asaia sp. As-1742]
MYTLPYQVKQKRPIHAAVVRCPKEQDDKIVKSDICPQCGCEHIYQDGGLWVCPECALEWSVAGGATAGAVSESDDLAIRDANGNVLADGDTVTIIKDLKVKGSSSVIKGGTKIKGIRLVDASDGHNLSCKIPGIGGMNLKSEFVRKA